MKKNHRDLMLGSDLHDGAHLAGHAGVVHNEDRLRGGRDRGRYFRLVDIQRVGTDVNENRPGSHPAHGTGGGYERVRRQDDFVARSQVAQDRRDFQ